MSQKKAIITGITGQDGAYLASFLLAKKYKVIGTYRRVGSHSFWRMDVLGIKCDPNLELVECDLADPETIYRLIEKYQPDEVYNLAAQSHVGVSFNQPVATAEITGVGPVNILEAIRHVNPKVRFYQASSSEMFGKTQETSQSESTTFHPRNPYGAAKLYAHLMTINYRESYDIFASSGILFNHESPLRGLEFVTRKITDAVAKIKLGKLDALELGNLDAQRDWGYAKDYVEGMWLMLQAKTPGTFVLATGRSESVRYFVKQAFQVAEIDLVFEGEEEKEVARNRETNQIVLRINPLLYRPAEVDFFMGDASLAKKELGWEPRTNLEELCEMMVRADLTLNLNA